jgi:arginase family enzyme
LSFNLIYSQGRVADKTVQTIIGAKLTAQALEKRYNVIGQAVGIPSMPALDDWTVSLPQANNTLKEIKETILASIDSKKLTILASNTCSVSLASLPVVAKRFPDNIVLWFDGHGDFNTPVTTDSGYLGGLVLAGVCGFWNSGHGNGVNPKQVVLVGAHDFDEKESKLLKEADIKVIPPRDVTPESILKVIKNKKVWIHIDWDVLEPGFIPADYSVSDGLLLSQLQNVLRAIPIEQVQGLELAEFHAPTDEIAATKAISNILDTIKALMDK